MQGIRKRPPAEAPACLTCDKRVAHYICAASSALECPDAIGDLWSTDTKRLKLVKAVTLVEAAIVAIGVEAGGLKAMDDFLDVVRELEALLEANTTIGEGLKRSA
ncbi:MAG: hypothetical protein JNM59_09880 [Hyphomonadaceae bacterium]|nr:hypothetical protein [Hyphomonadaceae bacterium]